MGERVLFISSSAADATAVAQMLGRIGVRCESVASLSRARQKLEAEAFGAVLTDRRLSDGSWKDVVRLVGQAGRKAAVVVTDALADARFWIDALEFGAYDVLVKPLCSGEVQRILANALREPPRLIRATIAA